VALDAQGNVYFSDAGHSAIKKWSNSTQQVTTLVSSGLNAPLGVAVDAASNVYFADQKNNAIKKWSVTTTLVSTLVSGLNAPFGVAVDGGGNVYFADAGNNAIKEWSPSSGQVTVLVSTGLKYPCGVAVDGLGNLYIADYGDSAIKKYTAVYLALSAASRNEGANAGTDSISFQVLPATTVLTATSNQSWLTITGTSGGAIGFSFTANTSLSSRSAQITVLGQTVTVTQSADVPAVITKTAGDGQSAVGGQAFATALQVHVADANGVALPGVGVTFAVSPGGSGASATFSATPPMPILTTSRGNATAPALTANSIGGAFAATASVNALSVAFALTNLVYNYLGASSVTVGNTAGSGSVLLLSTGTWTASSNASWLQLSAGNTSGTGNALIQFTYSANPNTSAQTGTLTIAGLTFTVTQAGTSYVPANLVTSLVSSGLSTPQGVAVDGSGNLYIADTANNAIKEWTASTQQVSALVSSGLNYPSGVAVDSQGNVYFADEKNNAIKKWSVATGTVTSLVSSGLSSPVGLALDAQGNIYFSDAGHNAIKKWSTGTQQVTTLVSTGLNLPLGVAVDAAGNVYFADQKNNAIKKWISATSLVSTLVSSGLNAPFGVAVDGGGNVYFADSGNNAIKQWSPSSGQVTALVSSGLKYPCGVAVDGQGNLYIADSNNSAIKKYTAVYLSLGAASRNEGAAAGTDSISFQVLPANNALTATSNQSWLTITGTSGGAIGFSFTANTSLSSRSAQITVLGQTVTVTQSADVPTTLTKSAGFNQSASKGQAFATALQVRATDAAGYGVQGVSVTFKVVPASNGSGGTFASSPTMPILTNASGYATAPVLTANSIAGTFSVTVTAGSLTATFTAIVTSN
jgi:DNA-binding beta-propeller fold protein YncE